jgi:hypothetical protein
MHALGVYNKTQNFASGQTRHIMVVEKLRIQGEKEKQ